MEASRDDPASMVLAGVLPGRADLLELAMRQLRPAHFADATWGMLFAMCGRYLDETGEVLTREALVYELTGGRHGAGTVALYAQAWELAAGLAISDGEFRWAVARLREMAADRATGQALSEAYGILTRPREPLANGGIPPPAGPSDARAHILTRFAEIDAELFSDTSPEGDVRLEGNAIVEAYSAAQLLRSHNRDTGLAFGIPQLDALLSGGLQRGELCIVCGFTSAGKTSLCVQLAWHAAVLQQRNVVYFTSETLRHVVRNKMVARHSRHPGYASYIPGGLDSARIRAGTLADATVFQNVVHDLTTNPGYGHLYLAQVPFQASLGTVISRLGRIGRAFDVHLVVIDSLQLLRPDRKREKSHEEMAGMVRDASSLAATYADGIGVPVVSPWQINRAGREAALKSGGYSTLYLAETAEAANVSDVVISLLEPEKITAPREVPLIAEVLKNRDGPRGSAKIVADYTTSLFRESAEAEQEAASSGIMEAGTSDMSSFA